MAQIAANSVRLLAGGNIRKQGDETPLVFQLADEKGETVDLQGASVLVKIANQKAVILEKTATINTDNTITFSLSREEATGHGDMRMEFVVTYSDSIMEIFPANGWQTIKITPSFNNAEVGGIPYVSVETMQAEIDEATTTANTAKESADSTRTELDAVVNRATDSDAMSRQAAVNADGVDKVNLKTRLDDDYGNVTSHLKDIAINAKSMGVKGDGVTDDTQAIKDLFSSVADGEVYFPEGAYIISSGVTIPSTISIRGRGRNRTKFIFPQGSTQVPFILKNGSDMTFSDFTIQEENHNYTSTASGMFINECENILFTNINIEGFANGFQIESTTDAHNKDITLRKCKASYGNGYGIVAKQVDGLLIDDCITVYNGLDGMKLEENTLNVTIRQGRSSYNGQSGGNGNGLDGYAGGESFIIDGLVAEYNKGAGIYVKTGALNNEEETIETSVKNFEIRSPRCRHNTGSGLDINRVSGDAYAYPLVAQVNVFGGIYEQNGVNGIYIRARNVTLNSPIVKSNQEDGIKTLESAYGITIVAPIVINNSLGFPGTFSGISLYSQKNRISMGVIDGANDEYASTGDFTPTTKNHYTSIRVQSQSDDTIIRDVVFRNNSFSHDVRIENGVFCIVHYGRRSGYATFGSEGSTVNYNGNSYIKTTSSSDVTTAGWEFQSKKAKAQMDSSATDLATLTADFNSLLAKLRSSDLMS